MRCGHDHSTSYSSLKNNMNKQYKCTFSFMQEKQKKNGDNVIVSEYLENIKDISVEK